MTKSSPKKLVICQVSLANNIPIIKENYDNFTRFYKNLMFFIICPNNQLKIFKKHFNQKNIKIIRENKIFNLSKFRGLFNKYSKKIVYKKQIKKRLNWYYQQILKINFIINNKICKNNNLVLWDADTVILKKINFFKNNESINYGNIFEYHKPYFLTSEKLLNVKTPSNYLSSINQFISLSPPENRFFKNKLGAKKNHSTNSIVIINKIFSSIFLGNKNFNHSMFSEYETIGLCKQLKNNNVNQKIIFFLRHKINGRLSGLQKKICIFFNCKHVTYEDHSSNKFKKNILYKKQETMPFLLIIFKQYIKFVGRKFRYLIS